MGFNRIVRPVLVLLFIGVFWQAGFGQKYEIYPYAGGFWPAKIDGFEMMDQGMWGLKGGVFFSDRFQLEGSFGYLNHFQFEDTNFTDVVDLTGITVVTIRENTIIQNNDNNHPQNANVQDVDVVTTEVVVTELNPANVTFVRSEAKQRGYLWEANASWNLFDSSVAQKFVPYLTVGVGGTTATRSDDITETVVIDQPNLTETEFNALTEIVEQRVEESTDARPAEFNEGSYLTFNYGGGVKGYRLWGPVGLRADFIGRNLPNFGGKALNAFQLTAGITFAWGER